MLTAKMRAARVLALLATLLVAWPAAAFGGTQLVCRMMGRVVSTCCCGPSAHGEKKASVGAELRARDCCEKIAQADRGVVPAVRYAEVRVDAAALVAVAPVVSALPISRAHALAEWPSLARAPPPGVPLFLKHCSLLS